MCIFQQRRISSGNDVIQKTGDLYDLNIYSGKDIEEQLVLMEKEALKALFYFKYMI